MTTQLERNAQSFLETLAATLHSRGNTQAAATIGQARKEFEASHWHELSEELLHAIQDPMVLDMAYELHEKVLVVIRASISPIAYVKLVYCVSCSPQSTMETALKLVEGACSSLLGDGVTAQARYAAQCIRTLWLLSSVSSEEEAAQATVPGSAPHTARKLLEEVEAHMQKLPMHEIEPVLVALQTKARGREFELRKQYTSFYHNAFDIVKYAEKAELPTSESELLTLAFKTAVAVLLSENIFNFGKLLNFQPFVSRLDNSNQAWVLQWVRLCNDGDIPTFQSFSETHAKDIAKEKSLVEAAESLRLKIRLMALLHMVFYTPFNLRTFGFASISQRCVVGANEVEPLLLAGLAQGIIKGSIDGLKEEVHITWVEPRVLNLKEVKELAEHFANWQEKVTGLTQSVATMTEQIPK